MKKTVIFMVVVGVAFATTYWRLLEEHIQLL